MDGALEFMSLFLYSLSACKCGYYQNISKSYSHIYNQWKGHSARRMLNRLTLNQLLELIIGVTLLNSD